MSGCNASGALRRQARGSAARSGWWLAWSLPRNSRPLQPPSKPGKTGSRAEHFVRAVVPRRSPWVKIFRYSSVETNEFALSQRLWQGRRSVLPNRPPAPQDDGGADDCRHERQILLAGKLEHGRDMVADKGAGYADERAGDQAAARTRDLPAEPTRAGKTMENQAHRYADGEHNEKCDSGIAHWMPPRRVRRASINLSRTQADNARRSDDQNSRRSRQSPRSVDERW